MRSLDLESQNEKRYGTLLALMFIVGLDWYLRAPNSRSRQLAGVIEAQASANLKSYPYKFRVMSVDGETAVVNTPRNAQVLALKALGGLYPGMNSKKPNDLEFIAAEKMLGEVQSEVWSIVLAQPGIKNVRWELDRDWLGAHQIEVPQR